MITSIIFLVMIVLVMTVNICIIVLANAIMVSKGENVMDAIQFIKEKERMCNTCGSCLLCPAWLDDGCIFRARSSFAPEQQVNTVKVWAEHHPAKTRQDVFLEQYPEAEIDLNGMLDVCPAPIFAHIGIREEGAQTFTRIASSAAANFGHRKWNKSCLNEYPRTKVCARNISQAFVHFPVTASHARSLTV
jgi:hypothetical protein